MKPLRPSSSIIAKSTFSFAFCVLIACVTAVRADDQAKSKATSADTRNQQDQSLTSQSQSAQGSASSQSSQTSGSTSATDSQGGTGSSSSKQSGSSSSLGTTDQKFIREAAMGGQMEVQMGTLGVQKAQNPQLKQYAQRLIDDHTKANTELKQLAASKGITLPSESTGSPSSSSSSSSSDRTQVRDKSSSSDAHAEHGKHAEHQASLKRLEGMSGAEFDREFVRMAVTDHQKDVKEFEKQAQKSSDPEVKAFAQKQAPILREHLQQAKALQSQVGAGSSGQGASGSSSSSQSGQGSSTSGSSIGAGSSSSSSQSSPSSSGSSTK